MVTEVKDSDGDRRATVPDLEKCTSTAATSAKDELDAELKDLGGDCIKVMQLLKADSSLLKYRALDVLHLGVSRGCIQIVEQVVTFYEGEDSIGDGSGRGLKTDEQQTTRATADGSKASSSDKGDDILGDWSETDQQEVEASIEEEINASSDNTDASTELDELQTQIDKNFNSDRDPSLPQDDPVRGTAAGKGTSTRFSDFVDDLAEDYDENGEIDERPVLEFDELRRAKRSYSGPARELDALEVAIVNGNLDMITLLVNKTRSNSLLELHRTRLREISERVVESIRGHSVSLKRCQSFFDAWRDDPEFNFLFWDLGLGQERVSEYLFHFVFANRNLDGASLRIGRYLWMVVWDYQGEPLEEPLWQSLLKLHDAQGRTPLHVAVDEDTVWEFKLLLDKLPLAERAQVFAFAMEATDGLGRTPWHRSVLRPNETDSTEILSRMHAALAFECRNGKVDAPGIYDLKKNDVSYRELWQHPMKSPHSRLKKRGTLTGWPGHNIQRGLSGQRKLSRTTPLHSALSQGAKSKKDLWYGRETFSPKDTPFRCFVESSEDLAGLGTCYIDALELATLTSNVNEVKLILKSAEQGHLKMAYTKWQSSEWGLHNRYGWIVGGRRYTINGVAYETIPIPTIHIAAYSGNYEMLKTFLDSEICDPYIEDGDGRTVFHAILDPQQLTVKGDLIDFANVKHITPNYEGFPSFEGTIVERQSCINLLLQSGCDIFQVDKYGKFPYPRGSLKQDKKFLAWLYDIQKKEFTANQSAMSFATNAISVMATLVATASYVGPLQPPLGYSSGDGPNQMQVKYIWVRIFVVCDTLSFYLAIAAIIFSLIPALPMPQQPMAAELEKTRGMTIWAVGTLFPSIVCILLAFAASSIVVVSANGMSSVGGNLTISTGFMGGLICLLGFLLLFIRLLRIIFPRVCQIRKLYDTSSLLFEGKDIAFLPVPWYILKH